ncbi:copper homeostasis protein [Heterobasidion irregulare TC 32-1]|uniref:Copper homeostasis protein cutC homolog n=1 Tax=Heterobasidion irregulare (strain TC 32-1) TaxID=747525 RepID=W4KMT4_HETIT|nr:copper homeostasis protein [Heterobasidion irregulare TC 32-1]ETW87158.1 copper homeostasis protein [Heterobasidion irregulare TC 32-1]
MSLDHNSSKILVEVCVDSVESAINAVHGGADRLELCGNLAIGGGTTPSMGLFNAVRKSIQRFIPIMVMVRPRTGNFLYTDAETDVMLEDIRLFKKAGAQGVVMGLLKSDGTVDVARTMRKAVNKVVELSAALAYRDLSGIRGITRILTSVSTAPELIIPLLKARSKHADSPTPEILPGSGINPRTVRGVLDVLLPHNLSEMHMSGGEWIEGGMAHKPAGLGMGSGRGEWDIWRTDERAVREVRECVDDILGRC